MFRPNPTLVRLADVDFITVKSSVFSLCVGHDVVYEQKYSPGHLYCVGYRREDVNISENALDSVDLA